MQRLHQLPDPSPRTLETEIGFSVAPILARLRRYRHRSLSREKVHDWTIKKSMTGSKGTEETQQYNPLLFIGSAGGWLTRPSGRSVVFVQKI